MWMGKTFESVSKSEFARRCGHTPEVLDAYNSEISRIGRNFFRHPHNPSLLQMIGMPALTNLWNLKDRPTSVNNDGLPGVLTDEHLESENVIPYEKTGGFFSGQSGFFCFARAAQKTGVSTQLSLAPAQSCLSHDPSGG